MLIVPCALLAILAVDASLTFAQKQYFDAFVLKYGNLAPAANVQKCAVCHGKRKVERSNYARTLEALLPGKKIRNAAAIAKALEQTGQQKLPDGMTYDDLLTAGQLPPAFPN